MEKPEVYINRASRLSASALSDFKKCPRYFLYRRVLRWELDTPKSTPLMFGSAWHAAMDRIWSTTGDDKEATTEGINAFRKEVGSLILSELKGLYSLDNAVDIIKEYVKRRRPTIRKLHNIVPEKEYQLSLTTAHGSPFSYISVLDKVATQESGDPVIIEHKTTSYGASQGFSAGWRDGWQLSGQLVGYMYQGMTEYDTTPALWVDATLVSLKYRNYELFVVRTTDSDLMQWGLETTEYATRIIDIAAPRFAHNNGETAPFPRTMDHSSCVNYNRVCPFFSLCTKSPKHITDDTPPVGYRVAHTRGSIVDEVV